MTNIRGIVDMVNACLNFLLKIKRLAINKINKIINNLIIEILSLFYKFLLFYMCYFLYKYNL